MSVQLTNGLPTTIDLDADLALALLVPNGVAAMWRDAEPTAVVSQSGPELEPHRSPDPKLPPPTLTAASATPVGALSGTYYYSVTALGLNGESLPSNELSVQISGPGKVDLGWAVVTGALVYRVYRAERPGGERVFYTARTNSFTDKGAGAAPGQAPAIPAHFAAVRQAPVRVLLRRGSSFIASVPLVAGLRRTTPEVGDPDLGAVIELAIVGWDIRAGRFRGAGDFGSWIDLAWRRASFAVEEFQPPPLSPRVAARLDSSLHMESVFGRLDSSTNGSSG